MAMVMPTVIDLIVFVLALAALNLPVSSCRVVVARPRQGASSIQVEPHVRGGKLRKTLILSHPMISSTSCSLYLLYSILNLQRFTEIQTLKTTELIHSNSHF